jgi:SAM-dependent methyltransferase
MYGAALRHAAAGGQPLLEVVDAHGTTVTHLRPVQWTGNLRPGDHGLTSHCVGSTMDVGCGPGRLVAALRHIGHRALGVDISPEAVRQARRRGASVLCRSVFDPLPDEGTWQHVLLADGNIGIGGEPERLLRRCSQLLAPGGSLLVELWPPGLPTWSGQVTLRDGDRQTGAFAWASVAASDIGHLANRSALQVIEIWTEADRWFARITRG